MSNQTYLSWVLKNTPTKWWHDSAEAAELDLGLERGAVGVTTNPFLSNLALVTDRAMWANDINAVLARQLAPEQKAEALMRIPVTKAAAKFLPIFEATGARDGYVCAQVNPLRAGDRDCMLPMARRFHTWAPNIAVKLPATSAGLDVLEDCVAEGITCTATVSFTVPQAVAIGERHKAGIARARAKGIQPGKCFAVIMIGRLDDYLREVAHDTAAAVSEQDICQSGLAATKRAYAIYRERGYEAVLLVAALRGDYHLTELAGADLIMSIAPGWQKPFVTKDYPRESRIACPIPADVIERLEKIPEFVRAYEPDGMTPSEFMGFGATQRTLGQFAEVGWKLMESFR
ncbi:MAG TPA: transaldolase family protein [Bryobacteraceae bacterium]|nr:transaldolase family protein [Bryobacteraceae bacterium]